MSDQITHGDLPNWYKPGYAHFVTYRVAGSLPVQVLRELKSERDRRLRMPPKGCESLYEHRQRVHRLLFEKYDAGLDARPDFAPLTGDVAGVVRENLYHHHGKKYELIAYCIMPNHVHVVLQPFQSALAKNATIAAAVTSLESADGRSACQ